MPVSPRRPAAAASVYISAMTTEAALRRFPEIRGLPSWREVFVVITEAGEPLLVTSSRAEAVRQVMAQRRFVLRTCH